VISRGDVHLVDFEPRRGSEADRVRPAVIVSNDAANVTAVRLGRGVLTVIPVTSNVLRVLPFQVFLSASSTGLDRDSKAQAEQIRAIDVERIGGRIGIVRETEMLDIEEAIRIHLGL
jgi:mRNA interferase MazF